jgi:hypothetical protein
MADWDKEAIKNKRWRNKEKLNISKARKEGSNKENK